LKKDNEPLLTHKNYLAYEEINRAKKTGKCANISLVIVNKLTLHPG